MEVINKYKKSTISKEDLEKKEMLLRQMFNLKAKGKFLD